MPSLVQTRTPTTKKKPNQNHIIKTIIENLGPLRICEENASGNEKLYDKSVQNKDTAYRIGSFLRYCGISPA